MVPDPLSELIALISFYLSNLLYIYVYDRCHSKKKFIIISRTYTKIQIQIIINHDHDKNEV